MKYLFQILITVSLFFSGSLIAGKKENAKEFRKRNLLVAIIEVNKEVVKSYDGNAKKIKAYKDSIQEFNANIKETVKKYWKLHKTYQFKTESEIKKIRNSFSASDYAYLITQVYAFYRKDEFGVSFTGKKTGYFQAYLMDQKKNIAYSTLSKHIPNKVDFVYGLKQIQNYLLAMEKGIGKPKLLKENSHRLKGKILLIDKKYADPSILKMDANKLPFKIKLVSQEEIDKVILSGNPKYAFAYYSDEGDGIYSKLAVLAEDAMPVAFKVSRGKKNFKSGDIKKFAKSSNK
jgi:hypothetical protein